MTIHKSEGMRSFRAAATLPAATTESLRSKSAFSRFAIQDRRRDRVEFTPAQAPSRFLSLLQPRTVALEEKDRLGNFGIQRLMSAYNEAETLATSVQKKQDDTTASIIGKI